MAFWQKFVIFKGADRSTIINASGGNCFLNF